uniref:papilin b, proteoglycan-like sulfated glycoprotein n=1 Tax=Semicossyphus pulcher TaxID=241346 RepID=UPI0037E8B550
MKILQILGLLQLVAVPAFTLVQPSHDYWGEFGAYGPCSRTCGTGVSVRSRKCITSRTDGGHNCIGSSKTYRTCNTQACPVGSRDFREEQCAQFDRTDFQSKHHTWILVHGEFMGLDEDTNSVHSAAPVVVAPHPRDTFSYHYKTGVFGECSAACGGGMQYRSVQCWIQDPSNPRVVEESYCITQRLQRPHIQQACNMHACAAEYSVSSFSVCSVTCGEGQQTREVYCVGSRGERLPDSSCSGVARPQSVQACRRPACHTHITWHVTDYGLCSRSCGGGVRERRVGCFDTDLNPYPEARCGTASRPISVESCNSQACPGAQLVPSVQDPRAHESSMRGFVPHVPGEPYASRPHTNTVYEIHPAVTGPYCAQSSYGCCPDGHTSARGPYNEGCSQDDCVRTRYGCCLDQVTPAQGFGRVGCPEYQTPVYTPAPVPPSTGNVCLLPRDEGPCDTWMVRYFYDSGAGKCTEFWFGSCQGNGNNFRSLDACQRECGNMVRQAAPHRGTPRRGPPRGAQRA